MPRLQYTYQTAGLLEHYAEQMPDGDATLTVYLSGRGAITGTWPQTVSLTAASSSLTVDAAIGERTITVADGSAFVIGQRYILTSTLGQPVEATLLGKGGNDLTLDQPLRFAVATGSALKSARYAFTLTSAMTGILRRRYRAQWAYEVAGVPVVVHQYFDVVREPFDLHLSEEDIEIHDPSFGEYVDAASTWLKLIDGANNDLERMLRARQMNPDLIRDKDTLKDALIFLVLGKFYASIPGQLERSKDWRDQASRAIVDLQKAQTWYDADDSQAISYDGGGVGTGGGAGTITLSDGSVTYPVNGSGCRVGGETSSEIGPRAAYIPVG